MLWMERMLWWWLLQLLLRYLLQWVLLWMQRERTGRRVLQELLHRTDQQRGHLHPSLLHVGRVRLRQGPLGHHDPLPLRLVQEGHGHAPRPHLRPGAGLVRGAHGRRAPLQELRHGQRRQERLAVVPRWIGGVGRVPGGGGDDPSDGGVAVGVGGGGFGEWARGRVGDVGLGWVCGLGGGHAGVLGGVEDRVIVFAADASAAGTIYSPKWYATYR